MFAISFFLVYHVAAHRGPYVAKRFITGPESESRNEARHRQSAERTARACVNCTPGGSCERCSYRSDFLYGVGKNLKSSIVAAAHPIVSTGKNGPGTATSVTRYYKQDPDHNLYWNQWTRNEDLTYTYTELNNNGEVVKVVQDANTTDQTPPDGWASQTGLNLKTEYTYDSAGRRDTVKANGVTSTTAYVHCEVTRGTSPATVITTRLATLHAPYVDGSGNYGLLRPRDRPEVGDQQHIAGRVSVHLRRRLEPHDAGQLRRHGQRREVSLRQPRSADEGLREDTFLSFPPLEENEPAWSRAIWEAEPRWRVRDLFLYYFLVGSDRDTFRDRIPLAEMDKLAEEALRKIPTMDDAALDRLTRKAIETCSKYELVTHEIPPGEHEWMAQGQEPAVVSNRETPAKAP